MNTTTIKLDPKKKQWDLIALGDVHVGARACDKTSFMKTIQEIKKNSKAIVIIMGDMLDSITASDERYNPYEVDTELPKFKDQVDWIVMALKPIRKKILGILEGNHEFKLRKRIGYDFVEHLADELGTRYFYQSSIITLEMGWKTLRILALHGIGGGVTVGGQLTKIQSMASNFESAPELVLVGHFHRLDSITVPKMDDNLRVFPKYVGFTGSYYRTYVNGAPNYASDKWYSPSLIGYLKYTLKPGKIQSSVVTYD